MRVLVCIPARLGSTRFAGKVLAKDTGKFLIQHTFEQACSAKVPQRVIIATDDTKVLRAAESFGAECVLTSPDHKSGTDRIAEAIANIECDIVINVQADEPEIEPQNIDLLANLLIQPSDAQMATLAAPFENKNQIADPNIVKLVVDSRNCAVYFSRSVIPYDRESAGIGSVDSYLRHIGVYAYRRPFLMKITRMSQTPLEKIEKLEQLRVIENGYKIVVAKVQSAHDGIDTPSQYAEFVKRYLQNHGD